MLCFVLKSARPWKALKSTLPRLPLLAGFLSDSANGKYRWEIVWLEMGWLEERQSHFLSASARDWQQLVVMGSDLQCFQKCQWYWRDSSRLQWPMAVLPAASFQKQYSSSINSKCTSGSSKHPSIWSSRSSGGRSFLQLLISSLPHLTLLLPQANQFSEINDLWNSKHVFCFLVFALTDVALPWPLADCHD